MTQNKENPDNIPSPDIEKEGENVTGGAEDSQQESTENLESPSEEGKGEYNPSTETTKEEMTGYNELPDQEKVGGQ